MNFRPTAGTLTNRLLQAEFVWTTRSDDDELMKVYSSQLRIDNVCA